MSLRGCIWRFLLPWGCVRNETVIDILALLALALIGAGVYLWLGLPATLMFVGGALLALVAVLSLAPKRGKA